MPEKLAEFLTNKIGYVLSVIMCFLFPGMLFIYIWDREIFVKVDAIKLCIVSLMVPSVTFFGSIVAGYYLGRMDDIVKGKQYKNRTYREGYISGLIVNVLVVMYECLAKLFSSDMKVTDVIIDIILIYIVIYFTSKIRIHIWTKRQKDNSNDGPQEDSDIEKLN